MESTIHQLFPHFLVFIHSLLVGKDHDLSHCCAKLSPRQIQRFQHLVVTISSCVRIVHPYTISSRYVLSQSFCGAFYPLYSVPQSHHMMQKREKQVQAQFQNDPFSVKCKSKSNATIFADLINRYLIHKEHRKHIKCFNLNLMATTCHPL